MNKTKVDTASNLTMNRYSTLNSAPYIVHYERTSEKSPGVKNVTELGMGNILCRKFPKFAEDSCNIQRIGDARFKITFENYLAANEFVEQKKETLNIFDETWTAYIPNYKVIKSLIIHNVDDDIQVE